MNENMKKWVEALRSGEYRQGNGQLKDRDVYCCLGVACEVYRKSTKRGEWLDGCTFYDGDNRSGTQLTVLVADWLGVPGPDPRLGGRGPVSAVEANDEYQWSFEQIADALEKKYS